MDSLSTVSTVLVGGILPESTSSIFQLTSCLFFRQHFGRLYQQAHTDRNKNMGCISAKTTANITIRVWFLLASWPRSCDGRGLAPFLVLGVARPRQWHCMRIETPWNGHEIYLELCQSLERTFARGCWGLNFCPSTILQFQPALLCSARSCFVQFWICEYSRGAP